MPYYINYDANGKILGFVSGEDNINIEVSNSQWLEAQKNNKLVVVGEDISFSSVEWRTPSQIEEDDFQAKWQIVDSYMSTLEVTSDVLVGGNKFNVSPQGIVNIQNAMRGMIGTDTKYWVESWDSFNTNLVEMEWVLIEAERLRDLKIVEVGL